jgi:hypothetical protein
LPAGTNRFGKARPAVPGDQTVLKSSADAGAEGVLPSGPIEKPVPVPAKAEGLLSLLTGADLTGAELTAEKAAAWKAVLAQLKAQGAAAVPSIKEFLSRNLDLDFGADGKSLTGYASVRAALFDALLQIGGPEAEAALRETLGTTADPREIALIAKNLAALNPEQGRQEGLAAARAALSLALQGQLSDRDVGPIFELYQKFGGPEVVAELERAASHWNYYAAIALVSLPDGAGIPSLINVLAGDGSSGGVSRLNAYQMLASVAAQYPEARAALQAQVEQGRVTANYWPYLASTLGGDQFFYQDSVFGNTAPPPGSSETKTTHIVFGNQNFYRAPSTLTTPELLSQQLRFVEGLMAATSDPAAQLALQQAKDQLLKRIGP